MNCPGPEPRPLRRNPPPHCPRPIRDLLHQPTLHLPSQAPIHAAFQELTSTTILGHAEPAHDLAAYLSHRHGAVCGAQDVEHGPAQLALLEQNGSLGLGLLGRYVGYGVGGVEEPDRGV